MSTAFASVAGATGSPAQRADHGGFPFGTNVLSLPARRQTGRAVVGGESEGVHAELRREKGRLNLLLELAGRPSRTMSFATSSGRS